MKPVLAAFIILLTFALATAHAADEGAKKDPGADLMRGKLFPPELIMRHQVKLNLTDEQRNTIKNELKSFQSRLAEVHGTCSKRARASTPRSTSCR